MLDHKPGISLLYVSLKSTSKSFGRNSANILTVLSTTFSSVCHWTLAVNNTAPKQQLISNYTTKCL